MKKTFIVVVLFALPIVAYLFFASGVNEFAKLPVYKNNIGNLKSFKSLGGENIVFDDHITLLGFFGEDVDGFKGYAFNLNQKIYKKYYQFSDFQFVIVMPEGTQEEVKVLLHQLDDIVDVQKWKFVFGPSEEVEKLYGSLSPVVGLDENLATPYVFLVDKNGKLRGRKDAGDDVFPQGYNSGSIAVLNDKLNDDIKVILAEYRLELKKYNKK